jgi:hypothetical protein
MQEQREPTSITSSKLCDAKSTWDEEARFVRTGDSLSEVGAYAARTRYERGLFL